MTLPPLTGRQAEVLRYVMAGIRLRDRPPSQREIQRRFGWASSNAARRHLWLIARKGYIAVDPRKARAITVLWQPDGQRFERDAWPDTMTTAGGATLKRQAWRARR
jgi:SOS-response transcriptional repressor LexA